MRLAALLLAPALLAAVPGEAGAAEAAVRRFALVAGANDGGSARPRLRYATTDAASFAKVLVELGGVAPADRVLLLDPDRRALEESLAALGRSMATARGTAGRIELLFYYSGHSDEEGLLLRGGERVRYGELRRRLEAASSDVRIAILDSCASGAMTRDKGGVHRAPFLVDASAAVKGHAFLTSASAHEAAQESDRIRASFFTHSLITGLRGAADLSHDGRVTLNEAYHFAFQETLARTERTLRGPQHPNFDIQLVGTGDLVMTDLRGTSAGLRFHSDIAGRLFVRDDAGVLVAELAKVAGKPVELGLDPGTYRVTLDAGGRLSEARLTLVEGWRTELKPGALTVIQGELTASRGDFSNGGTPAGYRRMKWNFTLFPDLSVRDALSGGHGAWNEEQRLIQEYAFNFTLGRSARLDGAEVSLIGAFVDEDASGLELALGGTIVGGRMQGVQTAVGGNLAGELDGFQLALGVNASRGDGRWLQIASGLNWTTGRFQGAQVATGLNWAGRLDAGAQFATGVNVAREYAEGAQLATGVNWAPEMSGVQFAAGLNYAPRMEGAQIGVAANVSRELEGAQIALVNVGGDVDGAQIGLVNVATGKVAAQVGLVNVADESAVPIGLVSVARKGIHHLDLWSNEVTPANLAVRLGGKYVYGIFTGGARPGDETRFTFGLGLGAHAQLTDRFFVDLDGIAQYVHDPDGDLFDRGGGNNLTTFRLGLGYDLGPVAVIGGPTYNVFGTYGSEESDPYSPEEALPGDFVGMREWRSGTARFRAWPGFFLGMQL